MKQAYLIELDKELSVKDLADQVLYMGAFGDIVKRAEIGVALADSLERAIPVSESLAWQAKRDASTDKAK